MSRMLALEVFLAEGERWAGAIGSPRNQNDRPKVVFGIILRELRRKHGYSQDEFFRGFHSQTLGEIEQCTQTRALFTTFQLADEIAVIAREVGKSCG
jgi:hypothetical protein